MLVSCSEVHYGEVLCSITNYDLPESIKPLLDRNLVCKEPIRARPKDVLGIIFGNQTVFTSPTPSWALASITEDTYIMVTQLA